MENKQTAVEWLEEKLKGDKIFSLDVVLKQAKQMEKEQIKDAFVECWKANIQEGLECKLDAEEYYKKTYEREPKESN